MSAPGQAGTRRVLVVDDDRDMCGLLAHSLGRAGFAVTVCADAAAALRAARELRPVGIVTDVVMPGTDGLELCRQLRREPGLERAAILIITGQFTVTEVSGLRRSAREAGADGVFLKPFRLGDIADRLGALLAAGGAAGPDR